MIKENYIFFDIDAKNKEEALDFISSKAFEYGITDDKEGLLGDFLKREEEYSTGLQDLQYLMQSHLTLRKLLFSLLSVRTNLIGKH